MLSIIPVVLHFQLNYQNTYKNQGLKTFQHFVDKCYYNKLPWNFSKENVHEAYKYFGFLVSEGSRS